MVYKDEDDRMSDDESDYGEFPGENGRDNIAEFGWDNDENGDEKKPLSGRRKKALQMAKKRAKPGSFGMFVLLVLYSSNPCFDGIIVLHLFCVHYGIQHAILNNAIV